MDVRGRVTVVVLTFNRRAEALEAVARVHALPGPPDIVVVDNASHDGTVAHLRSRYPDLDVIALPKNIGGAGRNAGLLAARTPYVAFCDDDTWWEAESLDKAMRLFDCHPRLAVVTGRVLVGAEGWLDGICEEMARTPLGYGDDVSGYPVLGFMAGASVVRRSAFLAVGGFTEQFLVGGEEELVALDLAVGGWQLRYVPDVVVHHHPSPVRDRADRRRLILRNALWTALLRYPPRLLVRHGQVVVAQARTDRLVWPLLTETVRRAPWLLRQRKVLPSTVAQQVALLRATSEGSKV